MTTEKKVVLITGGSRGIGRAICKRFASPDTEIFFNYSAADPDGKKKAVAQETIDAVVAKSGTATALSIDISKEEDVQKLIQTVMGKTGRIDVLVNNAGITRDGLMVRMKLSDWDDVLNTNLKGAFMCTQLVAKEMMKQRSGAIVNITSVVGATGSAGQTNYAAAKAGMIGLTKSAAKELASRQIRVNAVAPGFIETEMTHVLPEKIRDAFIGLTPLGRPGAPQEVANVVFFLASEESSYITGQVIHVNGGMYT